MDLMYKPDWAEAKQRFEAFYAGEIIGRPCVSVRAPKDGAKPNYVQTQATDIRGRWLDFETHLANTEIAARTTFYGGEAFPSFMPYLGPDQFSAFMGCDIIFAEGTAWVNHVLDDWRWFTPLKFDEGNHWWRRFLWACRQGREHGRGTWIGNTNDIHSGADCLLAMRGPEALCLDLIERPDTIRRAIVELEAIWYNIYDQMFDAVGGAESGTTSWIPCWAQGKFAAIQCDFNALLGPDMYKEFFLPELEAEANYLDHCVYHLDGPNTICHLDNLLAIKKIDAIQWVPGAALEQPGKPKFIPWLPLLKRIQNAGKACWLDCSADEAKLLAKELRPERTFYNIYGGVNTQKEAEDLLEWFRKNT